MFLSFSPQCSKYLKIVFHLKFPCHEWIQSYFPEGKFGHNRYPNEVFLSYQTKILTQETIRRPQQSTLNKHHVNSDSDVPWNNFSFPYLKSLNRRLSSAIAVSFSLSFHPTSSFSHLLLPMELGNRIWLDLCYLHDFPKLTNKTCIFYSCCLLYIWATYEQEVK